MCVAATAKRRRAQAKMGYTHMAPQDRPHYKRRSKEVASRHLQELIARERRMAQGKKK